MLICAVWLRKDDRFRYYGRLSFCFSRFTFRRFRLLGNKGQIGSCRVVAIVAVAVEIEGKHNYKLQLVAVAAVVHVAVVAAAAAAAAAAPAGVGAAAQAPAFTDSQVAVVVS